MKVVYLMAEDSYRVSSWYAETLSGVIGTAKRRAVSVEILTEAEDPHRYREKTVILLGFSGVWTRKYMSLYAAAGANVILICLEEERAPEHVHVIELDRARAVREVMSRMAAAGRRRILLFAPDRGSVSDREREEAYLAEAAELGLAVGEADVYPNTGKLEEAYEKLRPRLAEYDAAVCVNDFAALILMRRAMEDGIRIPEKLMVTGFGNMKLAAAASPSLSSVTLDYAEAGKQAMEAALYFEKHPEVTSSVLTLASRVICRDSTGMLPPPERAERKRTETTGSVPFFMDEDVLKIARANAVLTAADETDRAILAAFLYGCRSSEAAEACFISESTFKKRVNRLLSHAGVSTRAELLELLSLVGVSKPEQLGSH